MNDQAFDTRAIPTLMSRSRALSKMVQQVYCPPMVADGAFSLERWVGTDAVRTYRLGRHALLAALRMLKVGPADQIALPQFICRDVLGAIAESGAQACFYPVDERFDADLSRLPARVKAIIAVNYFGFPQDLSRFRECAVRTGAVLIEDNAHGFLSCDTDGVPLGCRAPVGIFSVRKTVALGSGGALVVNDPGLASGMPAQLPMLDDAQPMEWRLKRLLRRGAPVFGVRICRGAVAAARCLRWMRTGHAILPSDAQCENQVPLPAHPSRTPFDRIAAIDVTAEINRRRALYRALEENICARGGQPVFQSLEMGTCPYVFPFRGADDEIEAVRSWLKQIGLECHRWPDLPDALAASAPPHYSNVWMVPLIW